MKCFNTAFSISVVMLECQRNQACFIILLLLLLLLFIIYYYFIQQLILLNCKQPQHNQNHFPTSLLQNVTRLHICTRAVRATCHLQQCKLNLHLVINTPWIMQIYFSFTPLYLRPQKRKKLVTHSPTQQAGQV